MNQSWVAIVARRAKGVNGMERDDYVVRVSFTTEGVQYPIHIALRTMRGIVVRAASEEEAEAQADQIKNALEEYANGITIRGAPRRSRRQVLRHA
jgi:hypothetical protein